MSYALDTHLMFCIRRKHLGVCTMMSRCLVVSALCAILGAASTARADGPVSLWIDDLAPRDRLEVRTTDHHFRFEMVDPSTGEALASLSTDGVHFGPADQVFLLGATKGRHAEGLMFVRMGQVKVGKRIELGVRTLDSRNRRITAPVESIRVASVDPMASP